MIGEGRSINITLLFSLERYDEVIEAYIGGLEDHVAGGATDLSGVRSVASFFVSRVDTEVDRRLETLAAQLSGADADAVLARRGTAAVAQARLAYALFRRRFSGPRWEALAARGAKVQRPLWASTSTKNPAYPDLAYVDTLIGPDTVNTMPDDTVSAFLDHGTPARTVDSDPDGARVALERAGGCRREHGGCGPHPRGRGRGQLRQVLRRAAAIADRQGQRPVGGPLRSPRER